jgi:hypothetical protein
MKKIIVIMGMTIGFSFPNYRAAAQVEEAKQLILDIEKLVQLKQILSDLKKAYDILSGGYNMIIDISKGNFNLHKDFLDGLLAVSPAVQQYKRIAAIIQLQAQLVKEYKNALSKFRGKNWFTPTELDYISGVYDRLAVNSLDNLDDLLNVITANKLRMSDDERLKEIDRIFIDVQGKLVFLRHFNNSASLLGIQRSREQNDVDVMRRLYEISK